MPLADDIISIKKAAVFGSGAFGTALSAVLAKKSDEVMVWHMNQKEADLVNDQHENVLFLKGPPLAHNIVFTADVKATYEGAEIILFVIPTQFMRGFLKTHGAELHRYVKASNVPLLVCSKGIERSTLKFPAQILEEFFPDCPISVLAGPSFAIEVAKSMMTTNVSVASANIEDARYIQRIMTTKDRTFRCWANTDTVGCEVASAVKNVLAIASGLAHGLGMGLNARAALITRGLLEIRDLTGALGGNGQAVFGLAGLGDLLLTCSSELSRNFTVGYKLGQGMSMDEIRKTSKAVAEGVATAEPLNRLATQLKVSLPVCREVYLVVYQNKSVQESLEALLSGALSDEGLPVLFRNKPRRVSNL